MARDALQVAAREVEGPHGNVVSVSCAKPCAQSRSQSTLDSSTNHDPPSIHRPITIHPRFFDQSHFLWRIHRVL